MAAHALEVKMKRWATRFKVPISLDEADQRRQVLIQEVKDIEAQLGDKCRGHEKDVRMSSVEYFQWRRRAIDAKRAKEEEGTYLKEWMKEERRRRQESFKSLESSIDPEDSPTPLTFLRRAHGLLRKFATRLGSDNIRPEEQVLINQIQSYIDLPQ